MQAIALQVMASIPAGTFNNFTFDQFEFSYVSVKFILNMVYIRPHSYVVPPSPYSPSLEKDYIFWKLKWIGVGGSCTRACSTPLLLEDANFPGRRSTMRQALLERKFTRQHRDGCRNIFFIFFFKKGFLQGSLQTKVNSASTIYTKKFWTGFY